MLLGMMSLVATGAWAADPDLTNDYTLVRSASFGGADAVNIACEGACAYTAYDTGNKKQQALTIATAPEDAAGWIAFQGWTDGSGKGWWNRAGQSLYCVNAQRSAAVFGDDLTTGWLVVFECKGQASAGLTLTNADGNPDGTFSYTASEDGKSYYCTITAESNAYVGFCGIKNSQGILTISVYKPNKAVVATTYTVNYVDMEGNTLKESVTYDAVGGAAITVSDADKANITVGDDTYVYDSDDSEGKTVAEDGSSVVTVKFHKAQNFNYTVNEMCDGTAARVTESFSYETAKVTVPYRKYNAVDGQLYTKDATGKEYNYSFQLTQDNQVENIDYSAVSGVDNVVFLTEGEDVEGLTPCNSPNTAIRSSNSASAYATADTKIATLEAGKYKIHAIIYDASKSPSSDWIFRAGAVEVAKFHCTTVNIQEFDSDEFGIGRETDIIMPKAGSNNMGLDMIYIIKTGDVTADEAAELNEAADAAEALAEAKGELQATIDAAKAIDTTDKEGADALAAAITEAETAMAADDATVESLNAAKAALDEAVNAFNAANRPIIVNAEFNPDADPIGWTAVLSESFKDIGMYQIGGELTIRPEFAAPTADESHLATEFAAGFEARWASSFSSYTQTTAELPAGSYSLVYDVENVNAATTSATYENRFTVTVGETVYTDESTEWMKGGSAWTTHAIMFTLTENSPITISLGYGTGSNNLPLQQTPALYVSHLQLTSVSAIDVALKELQNAISAAQAQADSYVIGNGLFQYAASEIEPLTQAIATAQAAFDAAESEAAVIAATEALTAFLSTFAPAITAPDANKAYTFQLRLDVETPLFMSLAESGISIQEVATPVKFIEAENAGQFYLADETSTFFVGLAGTNAWTMSTSADQKAAWTFTALADGAYRINNLVNAGRFVGTNAADKEAGKPCYADKLPNNGNVDWIIAEYNGVTDGIKSLNTENQMANEIFNMNGQKVMKAQKGLYIINGKKVIVK